VTQFTEWHTPEIAKGNEMWEREEILDIYASYSVLAIKA
jgi:hypothetical protein